ncbi:hypothetical protein Tco_0821088 [Tanacetum coccineum]|uniref:Gag-Pol polyprotein n=1 Tax=Tanacetum coccineum TaxID=301880 RepID=A0ABQ5AG12_9ASTR
MCMFVLTVSTAEPKNIKEAMADSAWIEAMQEELHQFDRLQVWELVDKPFGKTIIKLKWLWKNKKDEDQTVLPTKEPLYEIKRGKELRESQGKSNSVNNDEADSEMNLFLKELRAKERYGASDLTRQR